MIRNLLQRSSRLAVVRRWCASLACAALAFSVVQANAADLATIEQRGVLRVAVPQDYPPFGSIGADLEPQGYDIDTARYLAEQIGVELELVPVTSANRIPYLTSDRADLVISSLGKTPEREQAIDFSSAYAPFFYGVFSATEEPEMSGPEALAGKTIGATRGALEEIKLTEVAPSSTTLRRYEDNATTLSAFTSGQVDYVATGSPVAAALATRGGARTPHLVLTLQDSPCYIGISKGNQALKEKVDSLIAAGLADGTFDAMSERWFGMPLPESMRSL
ncbi:transporter substrate-binding domain-containing protein [Halotalea alkalilenta]|uniref:transporter substrate-binding domain-containing protein n=1 Tax=Halotalea alkalilenta TaxID=376489 RepID=UPI000694E734|nr:transporter substrate-binding domain-containing protein [Halotalea alkalilenta]